MVGYKQTHTHKQILSLCSNTVYLVASVARKFNNKNAQKDWQWKTERTHCAFQLHKLTQ